jgi:hypothetical protein
MDKLTLPANLHSFAPSLPACLPILPVRSQDSYSCTCVMKVMRMRQAFDRRVVFKYSYTQIILIKKIGDIFR